MLLSEKLKAQTKILHQQLEIELITIIRSITSEKEYAELLSVFYLFFGALENKIEALLNKDFLPDYLTRRKVNLLLKDLKELNTAIMLRPDPAIAAFITTPAEAIGSMYVMEGSTLGGSAVQLMIERQLNQHTKGFNFFNGYGPATVAKWKIFQQALNNASFSAEEEKDIITAANNNFKNFKSFIQQYFLGLAENKY